jgi:hypothetical protein
MGSHWLPIVLAVTALVEAILTAALAVLSFGVLALDAICATNASAQYFDLKYLHDVNLF